MPETTPSPDYAAMPERELDCLIAERLFGGKYELRVSRSKWFDQRRKARLCLVNAQHTQDWLMPIPDDETPERDYEGSSIPHYSTDPAAAIEVENRIAEFGEAAMHAYSVVLAGALWLDARGRPDLRGWRDCRDTWAIIRATPRQRCLAALAALPPEGSVPRD